MVLASDSPFVGEPLGATRMRTRTAASIVAVIRAGTTHPSPGPEFLLEEGDVLVAPNTDPAWTPLFIPAAAVIVNVGAAGSHSMIVCRELGIPCIVGVQGVYGWRGTNEHGGKRALPDWEDIALNGRDYELYDVIGSSSHRGRIFPTHQRDQQIVPVSRSDEPAERVRPLNASTVPDRPPENGPRPSSIPDGPGSAEIMAREGAPEVRWWER